MFCSKHKQDWTIHPNSHAPSVATDRLPIIDLLGTNPCALSNLPFRANRVLAVLSKMFSLATLWKLRSNNPCKSVKRNTEEGRERYLEPDEIARLMKALAGLGDQESANAIMLALLTGARRGELLRATWAQFDLKKGIWTKPSAHTKQKKTHRVPLSLEAWQLLTAMRAAAPDATHLFPGRINAKGDVSIRQPWKDVCEAAGL